MDREQQSYELLGYEVEGDDFSDPIQGVSGRFLTGGGPRIELVAALPDSTVLDPWLSGGSRIYHEAFETTSFEQSIEHLQRAGARVTTAPVPAVAFGGRDIAFLMLRTLTLVELIQAP